MTSVVHVFIHWADSCLCSYRKLIFSTVKRGTPLLERIEEMLLYYIDLVKSNMTVLVLHMRLHFIISEITIKGRHWGEKDGGRQAACAHLCAYLACAAARTKQTKAKMKCWFWDSFRWFLLPIRLLLQSAIHGGSKWPPGHREMTTGHSPSAHAKDADTCRQMHTCSFWLSLYVLSLRQATCTCTLISRSSRKKRKRRGGGEMERIRTPIQLFFGS